MKQEVINKRRDDAAALCPFCAGEAVFEDHRPRGSCYYQCGLCGAASGFGSDTERDALTDWNTRT